MSKVETIDILRVAGRHRDALEVARRIGDDLAAAINAARMRRVLMLWQRIGTSAASTRIEPVLEALRPFIIFRASMKDRLTGWHQCEPSPDLFEIDARHAELHDTRWSWLCTHRAKLRGANLACAMLDDSTISDSDGTDVCLSGSWMCGAKVVQTSLVGAVFTDAILDDARFEDCDLRGADFDALRASDATARRTTFIRCDLRETNWHGRDLRDVMFIDCKLDGLRGVDRSAIDMPDVQIDRGQRERKSIADWT